MKLRKLLSILLCSFFLFGCSNNSKSIEKPIISNQENNQTDSKTEEKDHTSDKDKTDNSNNDNEKDEESVKKEEWPIEIQEKMKKYLGGETIPYINLGNRSSLEINYEVSSDPSVKPYLLIEGLKEYNQSEIDDTIVNYRNEGWTINGYEDGFVATKEYLEVDLIVEEGFIYLKAYYDEPYDSSSAFSWNEEVLELFSSCFDNHSLPYFYLGTKNPYYLEWDNENMSATIFGKGYKDEMVENALSILQSTEGWTTKEDKDSYGKTLEASYTSLDGCKVMLSMYNQSLASPRIALNVSFREAFDETKYTSWDSDTLSSFNTYLDGHELPVIYLGSTNLTRTWNQYYSSLTLVGGFYNESVLSHAETALLSDLDAASTCNWTHIEYSNNEYGNCLTATRKDFSDSCQMKIEVGGTSDNKEKNKCSLTIYFIPKVTFPSSKNAWSTDVQSALTEKLSNDSDLTILDGHELPYIYLNTGSESATVSTTPVKCLTIKGGLYNPNIILNAIKVYQSEGWETKKLTSYSGYIGFEAKKSFSHTTIDENGKTITDDSSPCEITAKISAPIAIDPFNTSIQMKVYLDEGFSVHSLTSYDDDIKECFKDYFNDLDFPLLDLGTGYIGYEIEEEKDNLTLYGGKWKDSLFDSVSTTLKNDGWTVVDADMTSSNPALTASKKDEDGTTSLTFEKYDYSLYPYPTSKVSLHYDWTFEEPGNGSWSSSTLALFKTHFGTDEATNTNVIPYTYLHVTDGKEKADNFDSTYGYLKITGGNYDSRILAIAKSNFSKDEWSVSEEYYTNSKLLLATKENSDGSYFRVKIFKDGTKSTSKAVMYIFYDAPVRNTASKTDWTDNEKKKMSEYLEGHTIPYLNLGSSTLYTYGRKKISQPVYSSYSFYTVSASDWTNAYIYKAKETLEESGYETSLEIHNATNVTYSPYLEAKKKLDDGTMHIALRSTNSKSFYLTAWFDTDTSYDESYSYDESISSDMNDILGLEIPSINLGTTKPKTAISYPNREIILSGNGSDSSLIDNAIYAFNNDKKHSWTLSYMDKNYFQYAYDGIVLCAKTTNDLNETVYVYVYQYFSLDFAGLYVDHYSCIEARVA